MEFDLSQTDALLSTTRAVRKRLDLDRPVPRSVLEECLDLAQQAPTGSNAQGWEFMLVNDPDKIATIAGYYLTAFDEYAARPGLEVGAPVPHHRLRAAARALNMPAVRPDVDEPAPVAVGPVGALFRPVHPPQPSIAAPTAAEMREASARGRGM